MRERFSLGAVRRRRALNAVHRPEDLRQAGQLDLLAHAAAGVVGGKAAVVGRVPVLRGRHQVKRRLEAVDDLNDLIALRHRQRTAGQKSFWTSTISRAFTSISDHNSKRNPACEFGMSRHERITLYARRSLPARRTKVRVRYECGGANGIRRPGERASPPGSVEQSTTARGYEPMLLGRLPKM